jgi:hypothetical protein
MAIVSLSTHGLVPPPDLTARMTSATRKIRGRVRLPVFEARNVFQNEEHLWSLSKVDSTTGVGGTSDWN